MTGCFPPRQPVPPREDIVLPRKMANIWTEVELGEFDNEEGDRGSEVSISLMEKTGGNKGGLIVWGIELRSKQSKATI